jgi:hypothetical protein
VDLDSIVGTLEATDAPTRVQSHVPEVGLSRRSEVSSADAFAYRTRDHSESQHRKKRHIRESEDEDEELHQQPPIYRMWAERLDDSTFTFHGISRTSRSWERLSTEWVNANFHDYPDFLADLRSNNGQPRVVPEGRAAFVLIPKDGVADQHGGIGELACWQPLTSVPVPNVTPQGETPYCTSFGPASAFRWCGFSAHAEALESQARDIPKCPTSKTARAVDILRAHGGWEKTLQLHDFNPLTDRSPHPTVVQLCDSDEDNTHTVGIAGNWIFDSNRCKALWLSQASLDACCPGRATFKRVSYAVRFIPGRKLKRARAR